MTCCSGLAAFLLPRSGPAYDEEQGIHGVFRDLPAVPPSSTQHQSSEVPHSSKPAAHELTQHNNATYQGKQAVELQLSLQLRDSSPTLDEQSQAAEVEQLALSSVASLPLKAHLQPSDTQSLPVLPRTFCFGSKIRQQQLEQFHPSLAPPEPSQQVHPRAFSRRAFSTAQQQHPHEVGKVPFISRTQQQQVQQPEETSMTGLMEASEEVQNNSSLPEGMAGHERSSSGQEQGLAMAEQIINAYGLGTKASNAAEEEPDVPGVLPFTAPPLYYRFGT